MPSQVRSSLGGRPRVSEGQEHHDRIIAEPPAGLSHLSQKHGLESAKIGHDKIKTGHSPAGEWPVLV
jgi:hypothetical protein